jgi:hypothetical protein
VLTNGDVNEKNALKLNDYTFSRRSVLGEEILCSVVCRHAESTEQILMTFGIWSHTDTDICKGNLTLLHMRTTEFLLKSLKGRDFSGDPNITGRAILQRIQGKQGHKARIGFTWLRMETSRALVNMVMNLRAP